MIRYLTGNLLDSEAQALVNTVNTIGVMGKGVALQFKEQFPSNAKLYMKACKEGKVKIGEMLVTKDSSIHTGEKFIINFPTKTDWRKPSEYSYIEEGLKNLEFVIKKNEFKSIAIPPLGAGNGGLNWIRVKQLIENHLKHLDCTIYVFEPNVAIQEVMRRERVKLTLARALMLDVLYDLVQNGEFVSEFAAEKATYFLQRFGAKDVFNLEFQPNFYGPYSGKVKHVLFYLNGSYISGYSSKDKKPFEELGIIADGVSVVEAYLSKPENESYKAIAERTKSFLHGFYSAFALELLSTIDFIITDKNAKSITEISQCLDDWSPRKRTLFNNPKFVELAANRINAYLS